ncbi:hypothetical protein HHI36_004812 [Cryptolaemus montrouzieri]|uniref:Uncharacterized protein n=1 Tax=Cryptolaemus montrouzieri TaxID=559131 RepID=A0ABD2NT93_9CUCU
MKINEAETLRTELDSLKQIYSNFEKNMEVSMKNEKELKEEINNLQVKLNQVEVQYLEALSEKSKLVQELNELVNQKTGLLAELDEVKEELFLFKDQYHKKMEELQSQKSKLELTVSELEFNNADLHSRLAKMQTELSRPTLNASFQVNTSEVVDLTNRLIPINQVSPYIRQISNSSKTFVPEDEIKTRGLFSIVISQKSLDSERIEANSSPDLGIESDQGRFSSLEVQTQVSRPLLETIEITESMNNSLVGDESVHRCVCGNKSCYQKSIELTIENNTLKKKLMKTRRALEETVTQLTLANQRKKQVEKNICRQIHKTSQVLREAKANLDSGSDTDCQKK